MEIRSIGSIARDKLAQAQTAAQPAQVWGESRRGVFLRLDSGWIVFLSSEPERGPLTVNVDTDPLLVSTLCVETLSQRSALDSIYDERRGAQVWSAPARPPNVLPVELRRVFMEQVLGQAQRIRQVPSLEALQAVLAGQGAEPVSGEAGWYIPYLVQVRQQRVSGLDPASLAGLLGLGSGLTPSGDDIVLGLVLALNRWGDVLAPGLDLAAFNQAVLALAYARTTTLSANLIECATLGQADERLVTALDGLMTGDPDAATCAALLAGWGSSSGLDALCGMVIISE